MRNITNYQHDFFEDDEEDLDVADLYTVVTTRRSRRAKRSEADLYDIAAEHMSQNWREV
ncbi:MAG TPA: hypothetical protein VM901_04015 [Bdellovibrionota bacterium]|jgi:hypothetical protein|nr:hypothetical protein [Bdellovibrionota bacterium]